MNEVREHFNYIVTMKSELMIAIAIAIAIVIDILKYNALSI
ncbi:hypothetical protein GCM10008022_39560 [Paenibacillus hunanensis]|nr:hypothetical protein GCM10008022_39560 [Paenibacillus hunanensis]